MGNDEKVKNDSTNQENAQKILELQNDSSFKTAVIEIVKKEISKEEKYAEIESVLKGKGIQLSDDEFNSFTETLNFYLEGKIKLEPKQLNDISAGSSSMEIADLSILPDEVREKIEKEENAKTRKALIILGAVIGVSTSVGAAIGGTIGYHVGKKKGIALASKKAEMPLSELPKEVDITSNLNDG